MYPGNVYPVTPVLVYALYDIVRFLLFFRLILVELASHKLTEKARIR